MFVGHYGPSFLAKRLDPALPLWIPFLAVQLLDVFWAIFIFLGVERVRIVPGLTETNALDLYYMPYTHSLLGALAWAGAAGILYRLIAGSARGGTLVGAAVFSHWPLDLLIPTVVLAASVQSVTVRFREESSMRTMLRWTVPVEAGNKGIHNGAIAKTIEAIMASLKPEAAYFLAEGGRRSGMVVFDLKDPSEIPQIAEPLFQQLNASVEFLPVMNADDLKRALAKVSG